jgi:hypothetical protein
MELQSFDTKHIPGPTSDPIPKLLTANPTGSGNDSIVHIYKGSPARNLDVFKDNYFQIVVLYPDIEVIRIRNFLIKSNLYR